MTNKFLTMTPAEKLAAAKAKKARMLKLLADTPKETQAFYRWVPKSGENIYLRCHTGKVPLRERIKLKCMDCCCWDRKEITECHLTQCGLWPERPYRKKESNKGMP